MATRRMFSRTVIENDNFIDMPATARLLYFDLGMRADDDGFINNPRSIIRLTGGSQDDLKILISKGYVIPFNSGVVVLRHWRANNYLRSDRYTPTLCTEEKEALETDENGVYKLRLPNGIPNDNQRLPSGIPSDNQRYTQVSIGKVSIGKDSIGEDSLDVCTEPKVVTVLSIPLNDKTEYPVSQSDIDEWQELYPAVDVLQQLRAMRGWCDANPSRRKTKAGIRRFINSWLSREQDRGGRAKSQPSNGSTAQKLDDFYDMAAEWAAREEVNA